MASEEPFPKSSWELGIHDAHCHPTDTMSTAQAIPTMKAATLTIMGTRQSDLPLVALLSKEYPGKVVPSFGYHPWFSYLIYDDASCTGEADKKAHYSSVLTGNPSDEIIRALPAPRRLSEAIADVRTQLESFPKALVGEIGIDRGFRIPFPEQNGGGGGGHAVYAPGEADDGKRLSNHRVSMEHQKKVFVAQLRLAGELDRAVSVHGVQCHGALFDIFRDLWRGHEIEVESRKEMKRRRRRGKNGDGHEYLPDMDDSSDDTGSRDEYEEPKGKGGKKESVGKGYRSKPYPPRICLHSFSAPVQTLQQYLAPPSPKKRYPSRVFFSFSSTINARPEKGHLEKIMETVKGVPEDSVLVESDLHAAGELMDRALEDAVKVIAGIKGLGIEECVKMLGENWKEFVYGDQTPV